MQRNGAPNGNCDHSVAISVAMAHHSVTLQRIAMTIVNAAALFAVSFELCGRAARETAMSVAADGPENRKAKKTAYVRNLW